MSLKARQLPADRFIHSNGHDKSPFVTSTFNVPILVDKTIEEININDYDALAIPGGFEEFGFYEEAYDERFLNLIREFDEQQKIIATIA
ncbi:DJ-1/PfpI family protein [Propionispora hippei]|uniref:DJ-1/PfpI family protein n=1 Tax=Propionispora hippei TaxID=209080 RepID=UPI003742A096